MKVLSLFDGISCGMVALERAGIAVENYAAFEIDKYAIRVSEKNYPMIEHYGNVFEGNFARFKGYGSAYRRLALYILEHCEKRQRNHL